MNCARSFILALFGSCSLFFGSAANADSFDDTNSVLRIEDLDPDTRQAVSNLAVSLSSTGDRATTATIDDNVAAILALLQNVVSPSSKKWFHSTPMWVDSQIFTLGQVLQRWLSDTTSSSSFPAQNASYLYQIQRAIYGQAGIPSAQQSLIPILGRIENSLGNDSVDMGWTNTLDLILSQLNGQAQYGFSLSQWMDQNRNVSGNLSLIESYLSSVSHSHSSGPYTSYAFDVYDAALADVYEGSAYNASPNASALRVVDPVAAGKLDSLALLLSSIEDLAGSSSNILSSILSSLGSGDSDPTNVVNVAGVVETDLDENPWWSDNSAFARNWQAYSLVYPQAESGLSFPEAFSAFLAGRTTTSVSRDGLLESFGIGGINQGRMYTFDDWLAEWLRSNMVLTTSTSISNLNQELAATDYEEQQNPTNVPLPNYTDLIAEGDTRVAEDSITTGGSVLSSKIQDLSGRIGTPNAEIVLFPAMTVGGISVPETRASLDSPITQTAHAVCVFIWYVALFASLFHLASAEFAFYANLGRNWVQSRGFIVDKDSGDWV